MKAFLSGYWIVSLLLVGMLVLPVFAHSAIQRLQFLQFDLMQALSPRQQTTSPIAIVDIDEKSLAGLGQWPWSRRVLAQLVDRLTADGAVVIGFDVVFPEPDRLSLNRVAAETQDLAPDIATALAARQSNDAVFAASLKRSRVVLGMSVTERPVFTAFRATPIAQIGPDPRRFVAAMSGIAANLPELDNAAAGRGNFALAPDNDGLVRRLPTIMSIAGKIIVPSLDIEVLRVALGQSSYAIRSDAMVGVTNLIIARNAIATESDSSFWISYRAHDPNLFVSAIDVLEGKVPAKAIAGHIVLIGTSAQGLNDTKITPLGYMPGVEIHAQALETILSGTVFKRPSGYWGMLEPASIIIAGLLLIQLVPLIRARYTILLLLSLLAIFILGTAYAYRQHHLLFDIVYPGLCLIVIYLCLIYVGHYTAERKRRQVSDQFSRYVSPALVQKLARDPSHLQLGGEIREMSVMFCDIRGFTRISERLKGDPHALTQLINRFMTALSEEVQNHSGTIDKYIGDCLMAFWNAPLDDPAHAAHACAAALAMVDALKELNEQLAIESQGEPGDENVSVAYRRLKELAGEANNEQRAEVVAMLEKRAEQGHAMAQYLLGKAYRDGLVGEPDIDRALYLLESAAHQGLALAQRNIGSRYFRGDGVQQDRVLALTWLTLAARDGLVAAEEMRVETLQHMSAEEIAAAERRAHVWRPARVSQSAIRLEMGIGVGSGECVVGNMGSRLRFDYSVLGDTVNLASRIESQSSNYGVGIVISELTQAAAPQFATLELDRIIVKGKSEPVRIYGLIGSPEMAASTAFQELRERHENMLIAYRSRDWYRALARLNSCSAAAPELEGLYDLYRGRIEGYMDSAPSDEWDGVFVAIKK